jgi:putative ABC transport system ATP-binding protein
MGTAGNMSILENMEIASRRNKSKSLKWGFSKKNNNIFKEKLASLNLGLENRMEQKIGLLSGGQRQAITLLMATLETPKILLLDEHTAALDPKTARIVLEITEKIVTENKLTTLMITHNMRDAIKYGDRLIMMYGGKIIYDVKGEEKKKLTVEFLLNKFEEMDKITFDN